MVRLEAGFAFQPCAFCRKYTVVVKSYLILEQSWIVVECVLSCEGMDFGLLGPSCGTLLQSYILDGGGLLVWLLLLELVCVYFPR